MKTPAGNIWYPYTQMKTSGEPLCIVKGEGVYLYDTEGKKYIDAISSWWVNLHGHAHPYIAERVSAQLRTLEHVIFSRFTHPPALEFAARLLKILPSGQSKIFFSDNGSTAVEASLKMAIQYCRQRGDNRRRVIALQHAYHGDTFGSMSVSERGYFTKPFRDFLFETDFLPAPLRGQGEQAVTAMKEYLSRFGSQTAAFIYEPIVQGAGGMLMHDADALNEMIRACREEEIITIADEVMTGFGRTGKLFASDYMDEKPDIMCLSKGITGGTMAMGVTSCKAKIFDAFLSDDKTKTFFHGHSYTANPLACTAALASLDLLEKKECMDRIQFISQQHRDFLKGIKNNKNVRNARCAGTILAVELNTGEETSYFHSSSDDSFRFFLERGMLLRPLGNILYMMPPYCISKDELGRIYSAVEEKITGK